MSPSNAKSSRYRGRVNFMRPCRNIPRQKTQTHGQQSGGKTRKSWLGPVQILGPLPHSVPTIELAPVVCIPHPSVVPRVAWLSPLLCHTTAEGEPAAVPPFSPSLLLSHHRRDEVQDMGDDEEGLRSQAQLVPAEANLRVARLRQAIRQVHCLLTAGTPPRPRTQ